MSRMKEISITIEGTTPLLMNRFTEEAQMKASGGTSLSIVGDVGTPREQAIPKVYTDKVGVPVVPGPNIFSCLIEAGKFHKIGKSKVTTQRSSMVPAGMAVLEIECPVLNRDGKTAAWEVDSRPIVNPATKGRRLCHRPRFDEWQVTFTLQVDVGMFDPKFVRQLLDDAGQRIGLGDFRPDRKGPFGKFKVIRWQIQEAVAAA